MTRHKALSLLLYSSSLLTSSPPVCAFRPLSATSRLIMPVATRNTKSPSSTTAATTILLGTPTSSTSKMRSSKRQASTTIVTPEPSDESIEAPKKMKPSPSSAPAGWQDIYTLVEELRQDRSAPCDTSGCEALPDRQASPKDFRFHVLISLMLSSQTKDAIVGEAVRRMQADQVLSVEAISKMEPQVLDSYIARVGFHNNKTKYIKQTVEILKEKYDGDIPPCAKTMMELPGVGPKMAYICENVAWNKQTGIGVDTHMHRLFNALRWVKSSTPEQTRLQLEAWLPQDKWGEVNLLWVGFGQEVQQYKSKILCKAVKCSRPVEALRLLKRCGLDYIKEGKKCGMEDEIRAVMKKGGC